MAEIVYLAIQIVSRDIRKHLGELVEQIVGVRLNRALNIGKRRLLFCGSGHRRLFVYLLIE
jgi:hypothetical protein